MRTSALAWRSLGTEDVLLLAAIVLLPWAFGGVEIWAYRSAALLIMASASVALWKRGWSPLRASRRLLPAFLLAGWGALQLVPLPPPALRWASPEAHRLYVEAFPGYDGSAVSDPLQALEAQALERVPQAAAWPFPAEEVTPLALRAPDCMRERWRSLSVQPSATLERLMWYMALLVAFLLLRARVAERERFVAYRWALFAVFAALALFALVQFHFWNGRIYWVRLLLVQVHPFGPYFNPTNFAGVMELAVPWLAGFVWGRLRARRRSALYEAGFGIAAASLVFCFVASVASASKLAIVLIGAALFALGLLVARGWRARAVVTAVALSGFAGVALLAMDTRLAERFGMFFGRSGDLQLLEGRLVAWQASIAMLRDFPVTGVGFGALRELFQSYLPPGAIDRWSHLHNDYLEVLVEGGIIAGVLIVWLACGYVSRVVRSLRPSDTVSPSRIGLALGILSLAIHAFFDFNHQIPANGLLWVACCAMAFSSASGARSRGAEP